MTRFSFSSLRVRLLLLAFLAVVPALGLILYTAREQRRLATLQVQHNMLQLSRLAASRQHDLIEGARQLLVTLARLPQVRGANPAACNMLFADLLKQHRGYSNLGVIKPNGDVFCSGLPLRGPTNLADRAYFQRALEMRGFAIGEYQIGRVTGKATVNFGYPVLDEAGRIQAVVFAALDLAWLNQFARQAQLPPGGSLTVIDRNSMILAAYPDPEKWVGESAGEAPVVKSILTQGEGTTEGLGVDGVLRVYGFTPLDGTPGSGYVYVSIGYAKKLAFAEANQILARNLGFLGLVTMMLLSIAWVGGDLFILRQVNNLLTVTRRLATGDLSARTGGPYGRSELSQLARAFDEMAESLEQATVHLEATVEDRTRELQATNVQLQEATRQAEAASRHKSEFLANMSHELRTPLNSVIGFSELLRDPTFGPLTAKQARYVDNIHRSGHHLIALINDLLDLSKVEAGRLDLRPEAFNLREALTAALTEIRPQSEAKRLKLKLQVDPPLTTLTADPVRFKQILFNLFSNAVKFTPEGGAVTVTARRLPDSEIHAPSSEPGTWNLEPGTARVSEIVEIAVQDTGIGIKAEDLPKLFQPFTQLESPFAKGHQGTGLGLALTKQLVELHGGTIWAESEGEGKGSRFAVLLPRVGPRGMPQLLLVEDDEALAGTLLDGLQAAGYQVEIARDGATALTQIPATRPDLVILDLRLPIVDGWEVLRQLRADPGTRSLPILTITGVDVELAEEALTAGADEFLTKPFSPAVLENTIQRLLRQHASADRARGSHASV